MAASAGAVWTPVAPANLGRLAGSECAGSSSQTGQYAWESLGRLIKCIGNYYFGGKCVYLGSFGIRFWVAGTCSGLRLGRAWFAIGRFKFWSQTCHQLCVPCSSVTWTLVKPIGFSRLTSFSFHTPISNKLPPCPLFEEGHQRHSKEAYT